MQTSGWLGQVLNTGFLQKFVDAFRTQTMSELCVCAFLDIFFNSLPISFVISNFLTARTDRDQSAQRLHLAETILVIVRGFS